MNTIIELYEWGALQLGTSELAAFEAKFLLAHVLQRNQTFLYQHPNDTVLEENIKNYQALIARRIQHEPLSYLSGQKEFYSLTFEVFYDTLIPRLQTELLVKTVLENLSGYNEVLDLGTGCGTIGCTLAYLKPDWLIIATDICPKALQIAKRNAEKLQLNNIQFIESNWFESLSNKQFDGIISNPPYLRDQDISTLFGEALFEPRIALSLGPTGYEAFELILRECHSYLKPGGLLALEHGFDQAEKLQTLLAPQFSQISTIYDSAGNARVTVGHKIK